jgi:hypothetical protein
VSVVQVHPDVESMRRHMEVVRQPSPLHADRERGACSFFGPPSDEVLGVMIQLASPGVPVDVKPRHLAGFTRSAAAG